ncbi:ABC transporter substrate-binding protein [Nocardioides bruguierae]|uniref:Extracellular solute-binding protein n=1 Tax=Nocardioides bruguierae TaxID=2945102 RepID=A0A9X2D6D6_9ACTN|nr:extracellular solute-binding protein [Nocardioides bruguierae]MCL8025095.1 extracellular solute-binding protein [Nocardioides bruguierae]MCM0620100.1 extracellular solute-binding protein [Nocardioides bruguierae]
MATLLTGALLVGCSTEGESGLSGQPTVSSSADASDTASGTPTEDLPELTVGLWGTKPVVAAYRRAIDRYNATSQLAQVTLTVWDSRADAVDAISAGDVPDVYLASRRDLAFLLQEGLTRPVDELLDERFVDFGDDYSREALEAFSADRRLQCMPSTVDPQVIYYNTDLIDFDAMEAAGREVPSESRRSWSIEEALAAARWAVNDNHGGAAAGLYIDPSLSGISAFLYSGGGQLFDDDDDPTSLVLSSDSDVESLTRLLRIMRNKQVSLTPGQLSRKSAQQWFEDGELGMMVGTRSQVPALRKSGVSFDVIPLPSIGDAATVGETTAFCLDPDTESLAGSADLLAYLVSDEVLQPLAATGAVVPANQSVALSEAFTQPSQQPAHADLFTYTVRNMVRPPLLTEWEDLLDVVDPLIEGMYEKRGRIDVPLQASIIDSLSREVLPQPESEDSGDSGDSTDPTDSGESDGAEG